MRNCNGTHIDELIALVDGVGLYDGTNDPPHVQAGMEAARRIQKLDAAGLPSTTGKRGVWFSGMSNWNQILDMYFSFYKLLYPRSRWLSQLNCAYGGWDIYRMVVGEPEEYWRKVNVRLTRANVHPNQVQVALIKNSLANRNIINNHREEFKTYLLLWIDRIKRTFPNLQQLFIHAANYSGYAGEGAPRTEPNAFIEGVVIREVVLEHLQDTKPWIAWGPYFWANGMIPRDYDSLFWTCFHFLEKDGVHPSDETKSIIARMLMDFLSNKEFTKEWWLPR